jgi:hypothetical protein
MGKLLDSYNLKLPIFLARKAQETGYDPDKYMEWYLKTSSLTQEPNIKAEALTRTSKIIIAFCYYFCVIYLAACFTVMLISPIAGLFAILISPFLVTGIAYSAIYTFWTLRFKRKSKKSMQDASPIKESRKRSTKKRTRK